MKRVLVLAKAYYPHLGGVETIARTLAEGAAGRGFHITVLCFGNGPEQETLNGVDIRRVRPFIHLGSAPLSAAYFARFRQLAEHADIVHVHSPNPAGELAWLFAPRRLKDRLASLCTYQSDPVRPRLFAPPYIAMLKSFLARCSRIAVSTPNLLQSSKALVNVRERAVVVHLGVKTELWQQHTVEETPQQPTSLADGLPGPLGLFVGRMVYYKGVDVLLRAAAAVPGISLLLVGDGPLRPALERLAAELGITRRVRFAHHLDETSYPAIYRNADFFVLPSVSPTEAFGLTLVEAMAAGLPAISTELGTGTSYVNLHGETGFVVPPHDPAALAGAINALIVDKKRSALMGKNAALRAKTLFGEKEMITTYIDLYNELLTPSE